MRFRSLSLLMLATLAANPAWTAPTVQVPGLRAPVEVLTDRDGIPHIVARNEHDLVLMQAWVHARDRFFQMDLLRRQASGTLAELLGPAALGSDVELRTVGLRRAAERSMPLISDESRAGLEAYAAGVNAFLANHPLPPEYGPLELTRVDPWTPLDSLSIAKLLALGLSFDLDDLERTEALISYQLAGAVLGFDGTALFFEDLFRTAPFDPASTVPDATDGVIASAAAARARTAHRAPPPFRADRLNLVRRYLERIDGLELFQRALGGERASRGSNEFAVGGALTASGRPLLANDPHLGLDTPSTFYQMHLRARPAGFDVIGSTFAGVPLVIIGQNRRIAWGATVNPLDVTDVYFETVVFDLGSPSFLSTVHMGIKEPILPLPVLFRFNVVGDGRPDNLRIALPGGGIPPVLLIVPRRNQGPILALDLAAGTALSLQYTGFSGTREVDTFRTWNLASDLNEFRAGLETFDFGSQNWAYADVDGNIAYFTSAELPLREDLQAGFVAGLPPYFIREGSGGNEWLPLTTPQPGQAIPYQILPQAEMPHLVNPPDGYFVNANNDPIGNTLDNDPLNELRPGGGIFYLNPGYAFGTRAGRITQALGERIAAGPVTAADLKAVQADVILLDAQVLTPTILEAFANGSAPGADPLLAALAADPRVAEAAGRLAAWDFSTPTGIDEGYDASDSDGERRPPDGDEIANSISATIYSVWRGQMLANTIDAVLGPLGLPRPDSQRSMSALRNLLDSFAVNHGFGASGLNFFNVPGVADPATRRDILTLKSLADALDLLAGPAFAAAFGGSTDQDDYRWGRLHRIVLDHPLGGPFDVPPAGGAFPPPLADLAGIPVDGGFGVVDASSHSARADGADDFMFGAGPARRYVGEARRRGGGFAGETSLPGGVSGVLGSPFYVSLLGRWLTNDTYPHRQRLGTVARALDRREEFVPAD